ncbi:sensor domain-containing diguanylate cyclase, partial [Aduncisulcus paluster]
WNIVRRKQADEALRQAYAEMESKVDERTAELKQALGNLRQVNSAMEKEVDQRRAAERRLRQFERLVELSPDMVSLLDSDYRF